MNFGDFQTRAQSTDINQGTDDIALPLLGLAGEVGSLVAEYKKLLRDGPSYRDFADALSEELGDALWYIATTASRAGLSLEDIAIRNLGKVEERWGPLPGPETLPKFDEGFPEHEQLPRRFRVEFTTAGYGGTAHATITMEGRTLGDPLRDNALSDDAYRFHDAFHLAHAAILGWSPVFRWMLSRKRKSAPEIDDAEDGARAIAIEEGLSAILFNIASTRGYFAAADRVDYEILKIVASMTSTLEVSRIPLRYWERAILQGYAAWRGLRDNNGGIVEGDLEARAFGLVH